MGADVDGADLRREVEGIAAHAGQVLAALLDRTPGADAAEGVALLEKVVRALAPLVPRVRRTVGEDAAQALGAFVTEARALQGRADAGEAASRAFWEAVAEHLRRLGTEVIRGLPGRAGGGGVSPALLTAYETTDYVVDPRGDDSVHLVLRPGSRSADLELLLEDCSPPTEEWTVLTAWNPRSGWRSAQENAEAQGRLVRRLEELGYRTWRAWGEGREGWREESLFVHGLGPEEAPWLAREFEQVAVLCGRRGRAAELLLCGPTPEWTGPQEGEPPPTRP